MADNVALGLRDGQVCYWQNVDGHIHGFVWGDGASRDMGVPVGYKNVIPRAISPRATVVGWTNTSDNPVDSRSTTRAFVWMGSWRILGTLGGPNSQAFAVNAFGDAVGSADTADQTRHAFLYHRGQMTDLAPLKGDSASAAFAITDQDEVGGVSEGAQGSRRAVVWRRGKPVDLGTLPGARVACVYALNGRGDAAGYSETPEGYHAFLYKDGRMLDLGTLGGDPSVANGIDRMDDVVGASNLKRFGRHAFLWSSGNMWDVNDLVDKSSWVLVSADAIDQQGRIACVGRDKASGREHALLLTPQ